MSHSSRAGHLYGGISVEQSRMHLGDDLSTHNHSFVFNVGGTTISDADRKAATLAALAYRDMNARRNRLAVKLAETEAEHFEWIWDMRVPSFRNGENTPDSPGFIPWLASNSPIFWISGKPASGKSKLMKFISGNERCSEALEAATERQWHMIDFFFDYRLHKHEANTVEGMFKSLLSQLVERSPAILEHIASSRFGQSLRVPFCEAPVGDLRDALTSAIASTDCRVCIFIDGLDEFEGSFRVLTAYLKSLADGVRVKICLASRPEIELKHALAATPGIRMQDYNIMTIRAYVKDSFSGCAHYLPEGILPGLIHRISEDSHGVILWSQLVCGDVVKGMLGFETECELHERISAFPDELHEIYDRLFQQMDPRFTTEAALILYLVEFQAGGKVHITVLQRVLEWFMEQHLLVSYPLQDLTRRNFVARLEARLGGLIDIVIVCPESRLGGSIDIALDGGFLLGRPFDLHVQTIHKTLSAYLEKSSILQRCLPATFITSYPDFVWDRLYADFMTTSRVFETWTFEEMAQAYDELDEIVRTDDPMVEKGLSSPGVLPVKDWTQPRVALAKECSVLREAIFVTLDLPPPSEVVCSLRRNVFWSDAMCLHLLSNTNWYCGCSRLSALKPLEAKLAFLQLPAHQRAFWFSVAHFDFDEADRLLSGLDPPSELVLELCKQRRALSAAEDPQVTYTADKRGVIGKLFQRWRPEWCKPIDSKPFSNSDDDPLSEVEDTTSSSVAEVEDDDADTVSEDDEDGGGMACPSTP